VPKQIAENGLHDATVKFRDEAILEIIRHYTMESGVRNLEREVAHVVRKLAREAVAKGCAESGEALADWSANVTEKRVGALLGRRLKEDDVVFREPRAGVASGLAWTEAGGTLLPVEAAVFEGDDGLILTGNLGDVMKESARAALTFLRSKAGDFGLGEADFRKKSVHVHVPEGAIPKDGPSAGVTMATALLSLVLDRKIKDRLAMTGELSLTGQVLPIGGLKEKTVAAKRNKMRDIIIPKANLKDVDEIPDEVKKGITFHPVERMEDVIAIALGE